MPQEPSPIHIVPYGNEHWVIISQTDWAALGGYVYAAQQWIRSAGPCLKGKDSDVTVGSGVIGQPQGEP